MKISRIIPWLLAAAFIGRSVTAHEPPHPQRIDEQNHEIIETGPSRDVLAGISREYVSRIRPIFHKKCFDCHSSQTRFPWYYALPGVRQLIEYDIGEAREHLDMTGDFPFEGHHGTAVDSLEALESVIRKDEMPLWRYRLLHWGSGLTGVEREAILEWIRESQSAVSGP